MSANTPALIRLAEEQAEALKLRATGMTYRQIAEQQGVHESTAKRRVDSALAATVQEPADELRTLEAHRLDLLFQIAAQQASNGKLVAIDRCLAIMDRRAKLLGLDAPIRIEEHVITEDAVDAEIRRLEGELAANDPSPDGMADRSPTGEDSAAGIAAAPTGSTEARDG